jgi:AbrB family looped-hinge helix DNA binding protein
MAVELVFTMYYTLIRQIIRGGMTIKAHSIVSSKGQIVIPANLRKRYGLKEGTTVVFQEDRGRLILEPSNHAAIYALQGSLTDFPLEADLAEERQAEQRREDRR